MALRVAKKFDLGSRFVDRKSRIDKLCQSAHPSAMATMNVSLPDPMKSWVEDQAKDGRFSNVSDYVRDLIRRDQVRQEAISEIQALVVEGVESGPAKTFNMQAFIERKKSKGR